MNAAELRKGLPVARGARTGDDAADATEPMDVIFIDGLRAQTVIGICQNELHAAQPVRIDLAAGLPRSLACRTDRIGDTIDYGELRGAVLHLLATHKLQLLEALAEEIARITLEDFGAHWVRVVLVKPAKFEDVESVGVAIERRREVRQREPASVLTLIAAGMVPGQGT